MLPAPHWRVARGGRGGWRGGWPERTAKRPTRRRVGACLVLGQAHQPRCQHRDGDKATAHPDERPRAACQDSNAQSPPRRRRRLRAASTRLAGAALAKKLRLGPAQREHRAACRGLRHQPAHECAEGCSRSHPQLTAGIFFLREMFMNKSSLYTSTGPDLPPILRG